MSERRPGLFFMLEVSHLIYIFFALRSGHRLEWMYRRVFAEFGVNLCDESTFRAAILSNDETDSELPEFERDGADE